MAGENEESRMYLSTKWFLVVTYGLAAPLTSILEWNGSLLSDRFDIPPILIYVNSVVQCFAVAALLRPNTARYGAIILTCITIGAMGGHVRISSPLTAIPALAYTVLQVWFAMASKPDVTPKTSA